MASWPKRMKLFISSLTISLALVNTVQPVSAGPRDLLKLLDTLKCPKCDLRQSVLIQAQLETADLESADLAGANLSGAKLDGANLGGSNLSFASLHGASLRGANLRGANLYGADLRNSDLNGAQIEVSELQQSHWRGAIGIQPSILNYSDLHNAGVDAAERKEWLEAERWFSEAIQKSPDAAISWLGRGLSRLETGELSGASQDIAFASRLYQELGDHELALNLSNLSESLVKPHKKQPGGNGAGIKTIQGTVSAFKLLAPLAMKLLVPLGI